MQNANRYLVQLAACGVAVSLLLAGFIVLIDPYRAFDTPSIAGINTIKPRAAQRSDLSKSRILERTHARTVLLGNSRVEIGLNPASDKWPAERRPVINAAQAGTPLSKSICRLKEAIAAGRPTLIVLGVDIQDFLVAQQPLESMPNKIPAKRTGCDTAHLMWSTLFSISSLVDAVLTAIGQDTQTGATIEANGFNPMREYQAHVRRVGYVGLFEQKLSEYTKEYKKKPSSNFIEPDRYLPFRDLRNIMRISSAEGIDLVIYFHPYHGQFLDLLRAAGLWDSFEAWKQQVYAMAAEESRGRLTAIRVLDFSGYNEITTEIVPTDKAAPMKWYWEPGHYKSELGDIIIEEVVRGSGSRLLPN